MNWQMDKSPSPSGRGSGPRFSHTFAEGGRTSMIPDDHLDFLQAVWARRSTYTYVFFALNILVLLLMALAGGSTSAPTLMAFGVKSNADIAIGQCWRFVTPICIHIALLYLFFN